MMIDKPLITVFDDHASAKGGCGCGTDIIEFNVDIFGSQLELYIGASGGEVGLADIVPAARFVCAKVSGIVLERMRTRRKHIPCSRGCVGCCYYLVPLSVPEAFRLRDEIAVRCGPERRSMQRACLLAARQILRHQPPSLFVEQASQPAQDESDVMSEWYRSMELACPFCVDRECGIYDQRPLACREYFVDGSANACRGKRGEAKVVDVGVKMPEVLGRLAAELEGGDVEAVMMPLALAWCDENQHRSVWTWPAATMAQRFIEIVISSASSSVPADISQADARQTQPAGA